MEGINGEQEILDVAFESGVALSLTDMTKDVVLLIAKLLDIKDVVNLHTAMTNKDGRKTMLEAFIAGGLCYEGSKGSYYFISADCIGWLALRGIGLRYLSAMWDVPSNVIFEVAKKSPNLKYLHMNYDDNNQLYLEQLEACCPDLEEVMIRSSEIKPLLLDGFPMVELTRGDLPIIFCERPWLEKNDWHREPRELEKGEAKLRFNWRRLVLTNALLYASRSYKRLDLAKSIIESRECSVVAQDCLGFTALFWASIKGNTELVRLLLQTDASNIDTQISGYCFHLYIGPKSTALIGACCNGHAEIIELLIRAGANINLKDEDNNMPFDILDHLVTALIDYLKLKGLD